MHVARDTPHELLTGAKDHSLTSRTADNGQLRPSNRRLVDLYVSEAALDRAITFASALFWELESRGHQVTFAPRDQPLSPAFLDERKEQSTKRGDDEYRHAMWAPDRPTMTLIGTGAIALKTFRAERTRRSSLCRW